LLLCLVAFFGRLHHHRDEWMHRLNRCGEERGLVRVVEEGGEVVGAKGTSHARGERLAQLTHVVCAIVVAWVSRWQAVLSLGQQRWSSTSRAVDANMLAL